MIHSFRLPLGAWLTAVLSVVPTNGANSADIDSIEPPALVREAEARRVAAIEKATPPTVSVFVPGGGGGGSGVLISPDGFALTNFHVTSPAGEFMRCGLPDGRIYDAVVVGIDPVGDLAMIQLLGRDDFPAATFADSRRAQVGDWCMVIGNPFLLGSNLQPSVTWGILSGVGRYQPPAGTLLEYGDCLQTDASVNPGNSGGPIFDAVGDLLGIVGRCSFEKRSRVNVGVGYAISINQATNFLGYLRSGRVVDHATLGATVATDPDGGVRVSNILDSSDAFRRGIRYDSEILEIDGRIVRTANDVQNVLATFPAGWRIPIRFREGGQTQTQLVRLASVHRRDELLAKMSAAMPPPAPRDDGAGASQKESKFPDAVAERYVARTGYANYFFNRQEQVSFIESLRSQFPVREDATAEAAWVIRGMTDAANPKPVKMRIEGLNTTAVIGDQVVEFEFESDYYDEVSRGSFASLAVALESWRRMRQAGPQRYGETFYVGTMPLAGKRPLRDCVAGIVGDLETRFLSHPASGTLEVVEVFADRDNDPAELWMEWSDDPTAPPAAVELRRGTETIVRVMIDSWDVDPIGESS